MFMHAEIIKAEFQEGAKNVVIHVHFMDVIDDMSFIYHDDDGEGMPTTRKMVASAAPGYKLEDMNLYPSLENGHKIVAMLQDTDIQLDVVDVDSDVFDARAIVGFR